MRHSEPNILRLPVRLVNEIGGHDQTAIVKQQSNVSSRKVQRKAHRVQKKAQQGRLSLLVRQRNKAVDQNNVLSNIIRSRRAVPNKLPEGEEFQLEGSKPILESVTLPKKFTVGSAARKLFPLRSVESSSSITTKLQQDDAEIATLEKKLGIKNRAKLPRPFVYDGLDDLVDGLDKWSDVDIHEVSTDEVANDWLAKKRSSSTFQLGFGSWSRGAEGSDSEEKGLVSGSLDDDASFMGATGEVPHKIRAEGAGGVRVGFENSGAQPDGISQYSQHVHIKENPPIPPGSARSPDVPKNSPCMRQPPSQVGASTHLRRHIQGLINRLTETNLLSILAGIEKLYQENARQHVTSTLVDILLVPLCDSATLPHTLVILSAGFIAAAYKIIGIDFGAQLIEKLVALFDEHYGTAKESFASLSASQTLESNKGLSNIMALLAELYNFQVVGSLLIFDYIRIFLKSLSEVNTELLLRIIRVSGPQLRHEDPASLKDIVDILRRAVVDTGESNLSARTKFMIESINDLKNNRAKAGAATSSVIMEHTVRMKRTIGMLSNRSMKSTEPLRVSINDIRDARKRGKWWLVGYSWTGNTTKHQMTGSQVKSDSLDLVQLAREQGMNTDVRRAIFGTIVSSSDHQDAYLRLMKLKLRKLQKQEIPRVIIHCSSAEKYYNPYYALISKHLCGDRRLRMAFQFGLWDILRKLGDFNDYGGVEDDSDDQISFGPRQLVNLGKMFGTLIADGCLSLSVLKNLDLRYLRTKTKMFLEVLFVTILLHTQLQHKTGRDEEPVRQVFSKVKDTPSMIKGLQYFLKKVMIKTNIAEGRAELSTLKWACKVAASVLDSLVLVEG